MSHVYYDLELINDEVASAAGAIEAGRAAMDSGISVVFSFSALCMNYNFGPQVSLLNA